MKNHVPLAPFPPPSQLYHMRKHVPFAPPPPPPLPICERVGLKASSFDFIAISPQDDIWTLVRKLHCPLRLNSTFIVDGVYRALACVNIVSV